MRMGFESWLSVATYTCAFATVCVCASPDTMNLHILVPFAFLCTVIEVRNHLHGLCSLVGMGICAAALVTRTYHVVPFSLIVILTALLLAVRTVERQGPSTLADHPLLHRLVIVGRWVYAEIVVVPVLTAVNAPWWAWPVGLIVFVYAHKQLQCIAADVAYELTVAELGHTQAVMNPTALTKFNIIHKWHLVSFLGAWAATTVDWRLMVAMLWSLLVLANWYVASRLIHMCCHPAVVTKLSVMVSMMTYRRVNAWLITTMGIATWCASLGIPVLTALAWWTAVDVLSGNEKGRM